MMPEELPIVESADGVGEVDAPTPSDQNSALTEDLALAQLKDRTLSSEIIGQITQNSSLLKSRKVRLVLATHPRTPRRIALRIVRELYTFDLMQFTLTPLAAADLRRFAEELLVGRLASITLGERISLARRSSELVGGALLLDKERQVWQTAIENPRVTESAVVKALRRTSASPAFVEAVSHHAKWQARPEVRTALLRNAHTPLARAIEFARNLPPQQLRDILHASRLPEKTKEYLRKDLKDRRKSDARM
jgi:hypothetical protein